MSEYQQPTNNGETPKKLSVREIFAKVVSAKVVREIGGLAAVATLSGGLILGGVSQASADEGDTGSTGDPIPPAAATLDPGVDPGLSEDERKKDKTVKVPEATREEQEDAIDKLADNSGDGGGRPITDEDGTRTGNNKPTTPSPEPPVTPEPTPEPSGTPTTEQPAPSPSDTTPGTTGGGKQQLPPDERELEQSGPIDSLFTKIGGAALVGAAGLASWLGFAKRSKIS
jgi:hypothetical protein